MYERRRGFLRNLPSRRCLLAPVGPTAVRQRYWNPTEYSQALSLFFFCLAGVVRVREKVRKRFASYATPRPRFPFPLFPSRASASLSSSSTGTAQHGAWRWTRRRRPCTPTAAAASATTCSRWRRSDARSRCSSASCPSASTSSHRVSARSHLLRRRLSIIIP